MDWLVTVGDCGLQTLAWLGALTAVFGLLTCLTPCNPGMYWWKGRRAVLTDLLYWFAAPLALRLFRAVLLAAAAALLLGAPAADRPGVGRLPLWLQCLAVLLAQDLLLYWIHRLFHSRLGWPFHAVHHSPEVLDWMSTQRFHPVNDLLAFSLADAAVLLAGFSPAALVLLAPFNVAYSAMVHANLRWTFGPLRYVLASPVFHRWHHTTLAQGRDRNFAPTFPFLDLLFGTFYLPPGELPRQFGAGEADFPQDFWGQLLYPFRRAGQPATPASTEHRGSPIADRANAAPAQEAA